MRAASLHRFATALRTGRRGGRQTTGLGVTHAYLSLLATAVASQVSTSAGARGRAAMGRNMHACPGGSSRPAQGQVGRVAPMDFLMPLYHVVPQEYTGGTLVPAANREQAPLVPLISHAMHVVVVSHKHAHASRCSAEVPVTVTWASGEPRGRSVEYILSPTS